MEDGALRLLSLFGVFTMLLIAWALSERRSAFPLRVVVWGLVLQFSFGLLILRTRLGYGFFAGVKAGFDLLTEASLTGARFLFGNLTEFFLIENVLVPGPEGLVQQSPFAVSAVVAFKVLPVIIFVSGFAAVLQHLRVIQALVHAFAWLMRRTLRTSGAETFGAALLVFLGIESVSALRGYLPSMTRSELFVVMATFLSTIAASVMVAYASFGAEPGHLLAASLMSAPAALALSKVMVPETAAPLTLSKTRVTVEVESHNVFDAAAQGAGLGLTMALNVGALLIVFVGLIYLCDQAAIAVTDFRLTEIFGWLFRPFAWVMGVTPRDVPVVAELLANKSVFNEFLAFEQMQQHLPGGDAGAEALSPRSVMIATYALCGFANPGSLGILIGGLSSIAPDRRAEIAGLTLRAFICGTLAAFMTACVAGVLG